MVCGGEPRSPPHWFRAAWRARQLSLMVDSLAMEQVVWVYILPIADPEQILRPDLRPEKTTEYNIPLYMAFVDYEKAFYSNIRAVFEALRGHGVQEKYINIIKETYPDGTAQIRTEKLSGKKKHIKGVRQGDTSPVMFTAAVEEIFKGMNIEAGININGVRLSNLRCADDIILFAESEEKLKDKLGRSEQRK